MKAKVCFLVMLMFCLCLSGVYGAENVLLDPGFEDIQKIEDVISGTNGPWQVRAAEVAKGPLSEPGIDREDKVEGEQSLYVKRIADGWVDVQQGWWTGSQEFQLEAGKVYTLSAWMKSSESGEVSIKITSWLDPFPNWVSNKVMVETEWKEYYATATAGELTERPWCEFRFETVNDLWIDFAQLYEGEYEPSLATSVTSGDKLAGTWGGIKD